VDLPRDLIELEQAAWVELQAGALTVETAACVQVAVTQHAEATGASRYEVEQALKKLVRHPKPEG